MKLLASILALNVFIFANTTMCYKNNIKDISTVESKKFDGGECKGKYSITDMKKQLWSVDDIKISKKDDGFDFIYILKKETNSLVAPAVSNTKIDYDKLSNNIKKKEEQNNKLKRLSNGKKIYINKCKSCHGTKGELTPYNTSEAINKFDLDTFKRAMRDYSMDEKNNGFAMVMKPYSEIVSSTDIEDIYEYLKSINK